MEDNILVCVANSNQNTQVQQLLLTEKETGNANRPPMFMDLNDFQHWKGRFENHINGVDTNLWLRIESPYRRPLGEDGVTFIATEVMDEALRRQYDYEKKTFAILSQAIPREIYHQFLHCKTSFDLWEALRLRSEGNVKLRRIKANAIQKDLIRSCILEVKV